jgi:hypothetical protein
MVPARPRATEGTKVMGEQLRLSNDNNFLPSPDVLQGSEFVMPVDGSTLAFYQWLMGP